MRIENVMIVGLGAIGSLYAVPLARTLKRNLRVFMDDARRSRFSRDGLFFNGERCDFDVIGMADGNFSPDLVIITTKYGGYRDALAGVAGFIKERTVVLPLLNGVTSGDIAHELFPAAHVLHGFFLGHASVRNGNRISHDGIGTTYIGSVFGDDDAVAAVSELFKSAGIDHVASDNILRDMWAKFILNIGINQTSAFFRADYGTVQKSPEMMRFAEDLMHEAVDIARANGLPADNAMVDSAMSVIECMPSAAKTSMLQDIEAGRRTEVDMFSGVICEMAKRVSMKAPRNERVMLAIKHLEDKYV